MYILASSNQQKQTAHAFVAAREGIIFCDQTHQEFTGVDSSGR
jgi:hypothetical protein